MKVYVLESGVYEDKGVEGVYATAEAAMAAWQPTKPEPSPIRTIHAVDMATGKARDIELPPVQQRDTYEWQRTDSGWSFDADYSHAADITEYEVQP